MDDNIKWIKGAQENKLVWVHKPVFYMPMPKEELKLRQRLIKLLKKEKYPHRLFWA